MPSYCHELIAKTAREMAGALWEEQAKQDFWYHQYQRAFPGLSASQLQTKFIAAKWPLLIQVARATLTDMLTTNISETLKDQIADALIKDRSLLRGKGARPLPQIR